MIFKKVLFNDFDSMLLSSLYLQAHNSKKYLNFDHNRAAQALKKVDTHKTFTPEVTFNL